MSDDAKQAGNLSEAGMQRRTRMLDELIEEVRSQRQKRRRRRRMGAISLGLVLITTVAAVLWPRQTFPPHSPPHAQQSVVAPEPTLEHLEEPHPTASPRVIIVRTDPEILHRYAAPTTLRYVQFLSDEELLAALAQMDRPAGLVRVGEVAWLTQRGDDRERGGGL